MELFGISFIIFFIMFLMTSLLSGAVFVFAIIYIVKQRSKDDASPRVTVEAKIVDKRSVSHRHHHHHHHNRHTGHITHRHYYHYVTFELADGQRTELRVAGDEYGLLAVGDSGALTLQGTRFIGFERKREGVAH